MDPRCTPQRVFHAHAPDQFAKLAIDPRPPRPIPRFPPPEGPNSSAMPTKDCFRLNDLDRVKQARPQSRHPNTDDATILPYHANSGRMEFSERTGRSGVCALSGFTRSSMMKKLIVAALVIAGSPVSSMGQDAAKGRRGLQCLPSLPRDRSRRAKQDRSRAQWS